MKRSQYQMMIAAAGLPALQARAIVAVMCGEATTPQRTIKGLKRGFKKALMRVLNFAKHETLRKLHRYMHKNRPLRGADNPDPGGRLVVFNLGELRSDLELLFHVELPQMLATSAQSTLEQVGFRDPWSLPAQEILNFISNRQNLLAGVPDEIFNTIQEQISTGLTNGESLSDISTRIAEAFSAVEDGRADVIADTESAAAYSYASDKAARAAGIQYKQWLHGASSKVPRADHVAIDGLMVPIDEPYPVGDPPLMYPHDENGSPEDVINCSCISIPVSASDYQADQEGGE